MPSPHSSQRSHGGYSVCVDICEKEYTCPNLPVGTKRNDSGMSIITRVVSEWNEFPMDQEHFCHRLQQAARDGSEHSCW
jgi:hypothetical protein